MIEIIAELGVNWNGRFELLEELIREARAGGADWIKLQLYDPYTLWEGKQAREREKFGISHKMLKDIDEICEYYEIPWFASVFDEQRIQWCEDLDVQRYKIASRTYAVDPELVMKVIDTEKEVFISLGLNKTTLSIGNEDKIKYFTCIPQYPVLWSMSPHMVYNDKVIGISDHSHGISRCLFAIAHGAKVIEKHFTLNKTGSFRDHIGSMDRKELEILATHGRELASVEDLS